MSEATRNDHEQLVQQIRFALETLGELNAHHDFERLCLGLARRRVASNVLPATGPVSAGGDQGRDAESHWTNLPTELPGTSVFVALASNDPVVLACTTQKKSVAGKIEKDVRTICKKGSNPVKRIVYFTVTPVPVARRHQLQAKAKKDHKVALDIWDAPAIAEHLADEDLFYLAVSHLKVPSSLAPTPSSSSDDLLPSWYLEVRDRWRFHRPANATLGELMDLRGPLRYATFNVEARSDLPEWIAEARLFLDTAVDEDVATRCRYEAVVATYRGLGDMTSVKDLAREFLEDVITNSNDPGLLEDAFIIIQYAYGHWVRRGESFSLAELDSYVDRLAQRLDDQLMTATSSKMKLTLLSLAARVALNPRYPADLHSGEFEVITVDWDGNFEPAQSDVRPESGDVVLRDRDKGMQMLLEVATAAVETPLYPINPLAEIFELMSPFLVDHKIYRAVRDSLDTAVEGTEGKTARGRRAFERANRMLQAGQMLEALNEVHEAKINWWRGDTIGLGIDMALLASELYADIGLPLAAKQYALSAATLATSANDPALAKYVPAALMQAAVCDHGSGMWLSATNLAEVSLRAHGALSEAPSDVERHPYFEQLIRTQLEIYTIAEKDFPALLSEVQPVIPSLFGPDWPDEVKELSEDVDTSQRARSQVQFADAGPKRTYRWSALGREWEVECENERVAVLAAERFIAMLQIVLCEMASSDPFFIPGRTRVQVLADGVQGKKPDAESAFIPSSPQAVHQVHMTPVHQLDAGTAHIEASSAVLNIVFAASLKPSDDLGAWLRNAFDRGLWHKLLSSRPYDETADLLSDARYLAMSQTETATSESTAFPESGLPKFTGYAEGFDLAKHEELIRRRYKTMIPSSNFTLKQALTDQDFRSIISNLRNEGWLDWHLLMAIANIVGNERMRREAFFKNAAKPGWSPVGGMDIMTQPELQEETLPASSFTEKSIREHLLYSVSASLNVYGLECHTSPPDFDNIFRFLGDRFGYWQDDVEHESIFGWAQDTLPS